MTASSILVQFRELLVAESLGWNSSDNVPRHFFLDLNDGQIYAQRDPESIMKIIQIGYTLEPDPISGKWKHILDLVAIRSELNDRHVVWRRPYYVRDTDPPDTWVSLYSWLKENGQNPDVIYSP